MLRAFDHTFRSWGHEECVCVGCGFVIWKVTCIKDAEDAVRQLSIGMRRPDEDLFCGFTHGIRHARPRGTTGQNS